MDNNLLFAFALPVIAGSFTGVGGLISLFVKNKNPEFLAIALSFSAGVMIYISFTEIFFEALEASGNAFGSENALFYAVVGFFGGILIISFIDKLIPHHNEKEILIKKEGDLNDSDKKSLERTGIMTASAVAVHNFPEGIITFIAALHDPVLGIAIALAIALHNIPEGIAVAMPLYYATGSRLKAIGIAFLAGMTEPLGAVAAYLFLMRIFNESIFGITFAAVAGIMVYVAFHQLLPASHKYGNHQTVMRSLFSGMLIMAISLVIMG